MTPGDHRPADGSPRNLVLCCDGTGNEVSGNLSNVLKLYRIARKHDDQRVYYDPGVGTIGNEGSWHRWRQNAGAVFGLATGAGLDDHVLAAYRYLVETWRHGDRIFLFGFSRGAYTVRVLAGFIHMMGLLRPDQANIVDYALTAYKRASRDAKFEIAWDFSRVVGGRHATIHFMGVCDTVASMIVPRPDRFYLPTLRTLPYTRRNPSVRAFRQAMAIDERRRMFRLNRWTEPQDHVANSFAQPPAAVPQDIVQRWFAGIHADVGGGYPEAESALSKFPLIWMIEEAARHGLDVDHATLDHLAYGRPLAGSKHVYVAPDACGAAHRSLRGAWWPLEWLPKNARWREWPRRRTLLGRYIPGGEPRAIGAGETLHASALERIERCPGYDPVNLKERAGGSLPRPSSSQR